MSARTTLLFLFGLLICTVAGYSLVGRVQTPQHANAALVTYDERGHGRMSAGLGAVRHQIGDSPLSLTMTPKRSSFKTEDFRYSIAGNFHRRSGSSDVYRFSVSINDQPEQTISVNYTGESIEVFQHSGYQIKLEPNTQLTTRDEDGG